MKLVLPRKVVEILAQAFTHDLTGNLTLHWRAGEVLGYTYEVKTSLNDVDRADLIDVG